VAGDGAEEEAGPEEIEKPEDEGESGEAEGEKETWMLWA